MMEVSESLEPSLDPPGPSMPDPNQSPVEPEPDLPLWKEFVLFILENKAWWLVPIAIVLALLGVLAVLTSTGAAPFIYTLF